MNKYVIIDNFNQFPDKQAEIIGIECFKNDKDAIVWYNESIKNMKGSIEVLKEYTSLLKVIENGESLQ